MTRYRTLVSSVLLASSLGFVAAPAFANRQDCGSMGARGEFREFREHRAEHMEKHHKKLHAALKLTPEQEDAWKKMLDAEQPMAKADAMKTEDWAKLTTPERADRMLERMKERQSRQAEHVAALKTFYAVLSPEQKKTFDDFHSGPRAGMRGKSERRSADPDKAVAKP